MVQNKKLTSTLSRRASLLFFVFVLVLSTLASTILNPTPASAAIKYSDLTDWDKKLLVWEYGRIMAGCYLDDDGVAGKDSEIRGGQFFYENDLLGIRPETFSPLKIISGDTNTTGVMRCGVDEGAISKKAFKEWDIDPLEFACSMGYQRSKDNSDCMNGDGDFKDWGGIDGVDNRVSKFKQTLKQYTGIDVDNPGDEIMYLFARSTVVDLCTTGKPGADGASGTMRYAIKEVVNGKSTVSIYTGGLENSEEIIGSDGYGVSITTPFGWTIETGSATGTTCLDVMNDSTEKFPAYWNTLQEEAVEKVCKNQGYINSSASSSNPFGNYTLSACINGFKNADNLTYCFNTYTAKEIVYYGETLTNPQNQEREACNFGRNIDPETLGAAIESSAATNTGSEEAEDESAPTCIVDSIGWIVCPLMGALGGMADAIYAWIDSILLTTPLQQTDSSGNETVVYKTWQNIRDIANVLLVIAFFIVILSQITSMGVSNYGVKKTLPRIIIVAIAINLSFFLMQLAIDVTNLIGTGLYQILTTDIVGDGGTISSDAAATGFTWTAIITTLLAGGIAVAFVSFAGLGAVALMVLPVLLGVVLSLFAAILTLLMRDAIIVILVILAPVAFVAYLLPNTQGLFNQWRKGLTTILFLYPTAAILFGGSKAASQIIASSATTDMNTIVGLVVMAAPLGMLPWLATRGNPLMAKVGSSLQGLAKRGRDAVGRPLNKYAKERLGENLTRRQAGTHGVSGRQLSDRAIARKQRKLERGRGGRNIAEIFYQGKQQRQSEVEANKVIAKNNYSRRTERAAEKINNGEKVSRSQRQAVGITNRAFDAQHEVKQLDEQHTDRMKRRVENNTQSTTGSGQGLLATQVRTTADKENTAATETRIGNIANADASVQAGQAAQDAAKLTSSRLEAERTDRAKEAIRNDDTQMAEVYRTAEATLGAEGSQSAIDTNVEYAKTHSGAMVPEAARGIQKAAMTAAGKQSVLAVRKGETTATVEEIKSGEQLPQQNFAGSEALQDLRWSGIQEKAVSDRTSAAKIVGEEHYQEQVLASPALAQQAGGIREHGEEFAIARASEAANKSYEANVSAYATSLRRQGLPAITRVGSTAQRPVAGDGSLLGIAIDTSKSLEERDAAGRSAVASGDIETAKFYFDHLSTELAAARTAGDVAKEKDIVSLQKSYAAEVAKSPGKPMGLGAAEIQQMASTGYVPPSETKDFITGTVIPIPSTISDSSARQTFATVVGKGVSAGGFASMDKNDVLEISGMVGELPAGVRASLKAEVDKALTDTQIGGNVKGRERELLENLKTSL